MKIFEALIGNEDIKNTLGSAIAASSFSHAYIIEGAAGTGKRTVARLASAAIMCKSRDKLPCGTCPTCKKILNDNCADVRFYEITKVEQARDLKSGLYESTVECDYKVYVITDAQKMNVKAQNALLISLEEPPKNVIFFILTTDAGALLETIRSRAQILRTTRLADDVIFDYVRRNRKDISLSDDKLRQVIMASAGSLGYAIDMADSKKSEALLAKRSRALDFVCAALRNDNDAVSFFMSLSGCTRDELKELFSVSLEILGDLLAVKKDRYAPTYFFPTSEDAVSVVSEFNMSRVLDAYNAVCSAIDDLNSNASQAVTLMSILLNSAKKGK